MTKGYAKIPHIVFQVDMDIQEKYMLIFLLDCENKFNKQGEWFGITDDDFIKVGFGSCKSRWRKYRNDLITKGLIEYRKGSNGKKSQYRITDNIEEKLMQYIGTLIKEGDKIVAVEYNEKGNKPSTEIVVHNPIVDTPKEVEVKTDIEELFEEAKAAHQKGDKIKRDKIANKIWATGSSGYSTFIKLIEAIRA